MCSKVCSRSFLDVRAQSRCDRAVKRLGKTAGGISDLARNCNTVFARHELWKGLSFEVVPIILQCRTRNILLRVLGPTFQNDLPHDRKIVSLGPQIKRFSFRLVSEVAV
jgi:hypothetical protein